MIDKRVKEIVGKLTTEVMEKLKKDESVQSPSTTSPINANPYLKLVQVRNGFILEINSDNPSEPPITEVVEIEDMKDTESIFNVLYGIADWLGIEDVDKLKMTYDGKVISDTDQDQPQKKSYTEEEANDLNQRILKNSFEEDIPKPIAKEETTPTPQPKEITKEMVIRAAMGLPPEETISQDEVEDGMETTEPPESFIQAEPEDYEIEGEEGLKDNEWIDTDYGDEEDKMSKDELDELENLPDGDFDENIGDY